MKHDLLSSIYSYHVCYVFLIHNNSVRPISLQSTYELFTCMYFSSVCLFSSFLESVA